MFEPLPTPEESAAWDRIAIRDYGVRGETLMETASREAYRELVARIGPVAGKRIVCLAGPGNNGGDAFGTARACHDAGGRVVVLHTIPRGRYRGEAARHAACAAKAGVVMRLAGAAGLKLLDQAEIIVDGLLGTGFRGPLKSEFLGLVERINQARKRVPAPFVFSLDTPSGLSALTGKPAPTAVRADLTVCFEALKSGLSDAAAWEFTGVLVAVPIGIPRVVKEAHPAAALRLTPAVFTFLTPASRVMHKGSAGRVLVVGGSPGLCGAPHLAARGALRAGAGLVRIVCPAGLEALVRGGDPHSMTLPLGKTEAWDAATVPGLGETVRASDALVIGPGMGRSDAASEFLAELLALDRPPAVLDADALALLAARPELLAHVRESDVLTPHPGEAALLLGTSVAEVQTDRIETAGQLADRTGGVVALKGATTVVAGSTKPKAVSPFAAPALAVGGSGDVLSGLIGALLAQGLSARRAACLGVYAHGLAGERLSARFPRRGVLAAEIADLLPETLAAG